MSSAARVLMEMYEAMRAQFGDRGWWPGDGPLEIAVGAILTQNTNWSNVEKAIGNLKAARCLNVADLHMMSRDQLRELIRPAGYYNVKAGRLKNFIATVERAGGDIEAFLDRPVPVLREALLSIKGVGRETADSIILYAAGRCTFVVDTYTYRICLRHALIAPEDDYEQIKEMFESSLPEQVQLYNDYHAQLVAIGKAYCRPKARCEGCPLAQFHHDPAAGMSE